MSLVLAFVVLAGSARSEVVRVRAWIDGRSRIVLQGDTAQWQHFDWAAPGRLNCDTGTAIEPTILSGATWYPNWPDAESCENRDCGCSSDLFTGLVPSLPASNFSIALHVVQSRGATMIAEYPSVTNGWRVVIEFDDGSPGGADWYEVDVVFNAIAPVVVSAQGDPFLAGQPDGTTTHSDTAPQQSPTLVALDALACSFVRFTDVAGSASYGPANPFYGPEDGPSQASATDLGISGYSMPLCALLGVFLPDTTNGGLPPAALDFSSPESRNFATLEPELFQTFFIGDGLRADGITAQAFRVPTGATRLFLGVCDGHGWFNNVGGFDCTIAQYPCDVSNPCGEWNLAADFRIAPDQENPNRDACGNVGVWHFLASDPSTPGVHEPSTYAPLTGFITDAFLVDGLESWQGPNVMAPGYPNLPSIAINATGTDQLVEGFTWPAGVVNVHPYFGQMVIVGWRSPYTGRVTVTGSVRDLDDTCASSPDGVAWTIDHYDGVSNETLVMGALADGGAQEFRLADGGGRLVALALNEGDFLYFTVDPLSEIGCDSTALDIVIRPATSGAPFCFGDGVDATHSTPCPCANDGAPGHGCGNSLNPAGALLEGSGTIEQDDVTLLATGMPSTVACVLIEGDGLEDTPLNDGVRCVGGNLRRVRVRQNIQGTSTFPDDNDPWTLSQRSLVTVGSGATRHYQVYYRNASVTFCPSGLSNLTNGWTIVW
ncbi:MAG: hypothetical protein IPJ77_23565 [Planctomycetes bacterium]|nr:hypothetical protein [Planctomycetota bacterium]